MDQVYEPRVVAAAKDMAAATGQDPWACARLIDGMLVTTAPYGEAARALEALSVAAQDGAQTIQRLVDQMPSRIRPPRRVTRRGASPEVAAGIAMMQTTYVCFGGMR